MADLIDRQQAIDAMRKLPKWNVMRNDYKNVGFSYDSVMFTLEQLPSAQPEKTCYGYDVKELIAFSIACRRAGVDEKDLKCFAQNCESAWKVMQEEFNNAIKETLEKW